MKLKQLKKRLGKEVTSAILPECSAAPSRASWSSFFSWRNGSFCHSRVSAGWEDGPPLQPVCAAGSLYVWIFFLASLSSACCGPHSFPACIQGQKQDFTLGSQWHRTWRTFSPWLLLCHSVHKRTPKSWHHHWVPAHQIRHLAMPSPTASRGVDPPRGGGKSGH